MSQSRKFLARIDSFLKKSKMSESAFGIAAVKDPNFVKNIRDGRQPTLGMVDRVYDFIESRSTKEVAQ